MKSNKNLKAKEIYKFGTWLTIFENGDVYVSTKGDVHIIEAKRIIDINDNRVKTIIENDDVDSNRKQFNEKELKVIKRYMEIGIISIEKFGVFKNVRE